MHSYIERLFQEASKKGTLLCFGMDPVIERMNIDSTKNFSEEIAGYFIRIYCAIKQKISAVKPNAAFYFQYGNEGLQALVKIITYMKKEEIPVIIDTKLGDIGKTSRAWARFVFEILYGDAVTVSPYLGFDALEPFFSYRDRGFYVLALTSNTGAKDFQLLTLEDGKKLYQKVLQNIISWNLENEGVGAVIGATQKTFSEAINLLTQSGCNIPLLVPGVGSQGGSYCRVKSIIENAGYSSGVVRVNVSSAISYARERFSEYSAEDAAGFAVEEILTS